MDKESKKLGVLGGLGPSATAYFFNLVVDNTVANTDQEHLEAIYLNHASMPDRTQSILSNDTKILKEYLIKDAKLLESLGVSHIAIPCNTSHYFWEEIQASVHIPVINMIEEVIEYVRVKYGDIDKIGVLATDGTKQTKLYDKYADKKGIQVVYPDADGQKKVMGVIYDGVKAGKKVSLNQLDFVINKLISQGCKSVILGCTELSVVSKEYPNEYVIDALYPLALKSIILGDKEIKGGY